MTLCDFLLSVFASLLAIGLVYLVYMASAKHVASVTAKAECWWLPLPNAFRFVIRNIPSNANLSGIRYRTWLRETLPRREGNSVETYIDTEISAGERLLLPGQQDLPILCFRFESNHNNLNLIVTDKMGTPDRKFEIIEENEGEVMVEFYVKARNWFLFKHEISRLYTIRQYQDFKGIRHNIFRDYFIPIQSSDEQQTESVFQYAQEVTVTI